MIQTRYPLPHDLLRSLRENPILELEKRSRHPVRLRTEHSNLMAEVHLGAGRVLMVKEPRHYPDSAAARFRTCRAASPLLEEAGVLAPRYLELPGVPAERPMLAYWRIPCRTLREVWPDLSDRQKTAVLRGYGALIGRVHSVTTLGWGPIISEDASASLERFLVQDLDWRLRPAVAGEWDSALGALDRLIALIPAVSALGEPSGPVLNHNDLHMSNVLCAEEDGQVRCVGLLDLEAAVGMPAELDFARIAVYHGPLFGHPLSGSWFERIWEGYGRPLHPRLLAFFKAYHLLNIGFHMAMSGNGAHAVQVLACAREELDAFS